MLKTQLIDTILEQKRLRIVIVGLACFGDFGQAAVREGRVEFRLDVELFFQSFLRLRPPKFLYIIILLDFLRPESFLRTSGETISRGKLDYLIDHRHIILLLFCQSPRTQLVKLVNGTRVDVLGAVCIPLRPQLEDDLEARADLECCWKEGVILIEALLDAEGEQQQIKDKVMVLRLILHEADHTANLPRIFSDDRIVNAPLSFPDKVYQEHGLDLIEHKSPRNRPQDAKNRIFQADSTVPGQASQNRRNIFQLSPFIGLIGQSHINGIFIGSLGQVNGRDLGCVAGLRNGLRRGQRVQFEEIQYYNFTESAII